MPDIFFSWSIYFLPLIVISFLALERRHSFSFNSKLIQVLVFSLLLFVFGFSDGLGPDFWLLQETYDLSHEAQFFEIVESYYPFYFLLSFVSSSLNFPFSFVFIVCNLIFLFGLFQFLSLSKRPWLSLVLAYPYYILVFSINFPRQSAALGLVLLSYKCLLSSRRVGAFSLMVSAAMFHASALIMLPFLFLPQRLYLSKKYFWSILILVLFAVLSSYSTSFYSNAFSRFYLNFFESGIVFTSQGFWLRIIPLMLGAFLVMAAPSILFINNYQKLFYWLLAIILFSLVVLAFISDSFSTIVDRLSAYLLPLALYPVSLVGYTFSRKSKIPLVFFDLFLIASSWAIFILWLSSSPYAYAWLPYRNVLF